MNIALRRPMTLMEFLDWEGLQEMRYEFDGFQPLAITGGTYQHDRISINLTASLLTRLRGKPCQPHGSNLKIEVMGSIRYPDAFVTCGPIDLDSTVARDPVVVFEVLSRGTAQTDRIVKNREYASTASIQRYVMLEQTQIAATMFERLGDDWIGHLLDADAVLQMPEIGIELPLAELYEGLDLTNPPEGEVD